ncbi:MAG: isochorismate synthase [Firmicutes bacterium]|nr:isochorismate synthase [Bacillota bacterium]
MTPQPAAVVRPGSGASSGTAAPRARIVTAWAPSSPADPVAVFEAARRRGKDAMLWYLPAEGFALVGIGATLVLEAQGPNRFADVARRWKEIAGGAASRGASPSGAAGPVLMGGFAFSPGSNGAIWQGFGDARLVVPETVFVMETGNARIQVHRMGHSGGDGSPGSPEIEAALDEGLRVVQDARPVDAGPSGPARELVVEDVPPKDRWEAAVRQAAAAVRQGRLAKAVLARSARVSGEGGFVPGAALNQLRARYPDCCIFAVARDGACFLGATPERLVRLKDGFVDVDCLAGSIGRGATPADDRRLARALLESAKDREEHRVVLRRIVEVLDSLCSSLDAPGEPAIRKLANVQHLFTPVRGRLKEPAGVLELAARLHPTPAMGGYPARAALELIRDLEEIGRGWYAGPIGWTGAGGDGEFAVAIRSALLVGDEAWLFSGCGIMGDSDPQAEYRESCLKLRPMLAALEAAQR